MAVSEPSMYKTCIIALMSPLAGVFLLSKLNIFQQVFGRRPESKPKFKPLWDARVQARGKKQGKNFNENAQNCRVRFRIAFFHHFLAFFRHFLTFVRWRTVSFFLLACSFFDLFGSGQASVTRKMRAIPFYPSWVRTKDASKYPP